MKLHYCLLIFATICGTVESFLEQIRYTVNENENVILGNVATDAELKTDVPAERFSDLSFKFVTDDESISSLFILDAKSGDLSAGFNVDAESLCNIGEPTCVISLDVAATVDSFFEVIHVYVTVKDLNDEEPTFPKKHNTLTISESDPANSKYMIDAAKDGDVSRNNSIISYELVPSDGVFGLDEQTTLGGGSILRLVIHEELDRETRDSYALMLLAHDNGNPSKGSSVTLDIEVTDSNDNPPQFSRQLYNVTITEGIEVHSIIETVSASDRDIGENAQILYKFSSGQASEIYSFFSLDDNSGELSVVGDLKYTREQPIQIVVEAFNIGDPQMFSEALVHVYVMDTNNNKPEIIVKMISGTDVAKVNETATKGKVIAYVRVKDADTGVNGDITCFLQDDFFELREYGTSQYNVIVKDELDRETIQQHDLAIECQDHGSPPMNSSYHLKVDIEDANDHAPTFSRDTYSVSIFENNSPGASIVTVVAFDNDAGIFSDITYKVHSDYTDRVYIDKKTGEITALVDFDREHDAQLIFEVYAVDGGSPPLVGTAKVLIRIKDVNDFRPKFVNAPFQFTVFENVSEGFNVGNISAFDLDDGDNARLVYTMSTQGVDFPFVLLSNGGIKIKSELDRETRNRYDFQVVASDLGLRPLSSSTHVTIVVQDINDNSPEIWYPGNLNNSLQVPSTASAASHVATVRAFDRDEGVNGKLKYSLKSKRNNSVIDVDPLTGELFVSRDIGASDVGSYKYDVIVSDGGSPPLTSYAVLDVQIGVSPGAKSLDQSDRSEYTIIAIVLVSATLVVAAAIILALVIIRKFDTNRGPRNKSLCGDIEKNNSNDMTAMNEVSVADAPKKVVQFTFPPQPSCEKTPEHYSQLHPVPPVSFQESSRGRHDMHAADSGLNQYQLAILHSHQSEQHRGVPHKKYAVQLPPKPDDIHSNSSGDMNASDSGKGGSVEDLRSQLDVSQADSAAGLNIKPPRRNLYFNPEHNQQFSQINSHTNSASNIVDNRRPVNYGDIRSSYKVKSVPSAHEYPYQKFSGQFLDCSMSGSGVTLEDDGDTTTSGSYTVDCDDLDMDIAISSPRSSNI